MNKLIIVFLATLAPAIFAVEIFSQPIRVALDYADIDFSCKVYPMSDRFILSAEIEGTKVTRAKLRDRWPAAKPMDLTPQERDGIVVEKVDGRWKLKSWWLSTRILTAVIYAGADQGIDNCYPPAKLVTLTPNQLVLNFNNAVPPETDDVELQGVNEKNNTYHVRFHLELSPIIRGE